MPERQIIPFLMPIFLFFALGGGFLSYAEQKPEDPPGPVKINRLSGPIVLDGRIEERAMPDL